MLRTTSDRHTPERRSARRGGLLAVAGLTPVVIDGVKEWPRRSTWLLSAQQRTPGFPRWRGVHSAAMLGAAAAVAGILASLFLRWLWLDRRAEQTAIGEPGVHKCRVLGRVRHSWVSGVLEYLLANTVRLALGLQSRPEILGLGGRAYCWPGRPLQTTLSEFAAVAEALGLAKLEAKDSA